MGKNSTARMELIIQKTVTETIKAYQQHVEQGHNRRVRTYYQKTEDLLYAYPALKQHLEQQEIDLQDISREGLKRRSTSIILQTPRGNLPTKSDQERFGEYYVSRLDSYEHTEREVNRIERALDQIKDHEFYPVIEQRYFEGNNIEDIAIELGCSESTVKRWRRRLVNKLKILLFGASAIDR